MGCFRCGGRGPVHRQSLISLLQGGIMFEIRGHVYAAECQIPGRSKRSIVHSGDKSTTEIRVVRFGDLWS